MSGLTSCSVIHFPYRVERFDWRGAGETAGRRNPERQENEGARNAPLTWRPLPEYAATQCRPIRGHLYRCLRQSPRKTGARRPHFTKLLIPQEGWRSFNSTGAHRRPQKGDTVSLFFKCSEPEPEAAVERHGADGALSLPLRFRR